MWPAVRPSDERASARQEARVSDVPTPDQPDQPQPADGEDEQPEQDEQDDTETA
jgi:hypothetical protein